MSIVLAAVSIITLLSAEHTENTNKELPAVYLTQRRENGARDDGTRDNILQTLASFIPVNPARSFFASERVGKP